MRIEGYVEGNRYPGRGIVLGMTEDGKAVSAYFIMGRSPNSRNRVFVEDGETLSTEPYDPSLVDDPSLIIYHAVRRCGHFLVVTNGDQTDTVCSYLEAGKGFSEALESRTYEPDAPNYTPRISGLWNFAEPSATLSIVKREAGEVRRYFHPISPVRPGYGALIHTYASDGNPLPSFSGPPRVGTIEGDIDTFIGHLWEALDKDNRISLFVRYDDLATKTHATRIINGRKQ